MSAVLMEIVEDWQTAEKRYLTFSEEIVTLEAGINMFQFVRLIAGLGSNNRDALEYRFSAKIDFNGFIPTQLIEETGVLDFN